MRVSYVIVEDNRLDELALSNILIMYPQLEYIATAGTLAEADTLMSRYEPLLVFVDIELGDGSGIEWVRKLKEPKPAIIFTTSHLDFALEGYEVNALDFLVKPVTRERFLETFNRISEYVELRHLAKLQIEQAEMENITFKEGYNRVQVPVRDIIYLQAMQDYLQIVTAKKKYLINHTLGGFLKAYETYDFIRIHRSFAVLKKNISEISHAKIKVANTELPIGKTYRSVLAHIQL